MSPKGTDNKIYFVIFLFIRKVRLGEGNKKIVQMNGLNRKMYTKNN